MKSELLVLIGLPASGKSTFAKEWVAEDPDARIRVNYDDLRVGMFGEGWVWNRKQEEEMKAQALSIVTKALQAGLSVVIDNTNLSSRIRQGWKNLAIKHGASYAEQDITTPIGVCIARDRTRGQVSCSVCAGHSIGWPIDKHCPGCKGKGVAGGSARVGQVVIDNMALRYGLLDWEAYPHTNVPIAIVDLDGTIANDDHRLGHIKPAQIQCPLWKDAPCQYGCSKCGGHGVIAGKKDWQAYFAGVSNDTPILRIVNLLERLSDHLIVLVSGRPIQDGATPVGILTEDWLLRHNIHFDRIFLKSENHKRAVEHKREILEYLPKDRVAYVFDDHRECIDMYRKQLPRACVLQVGEQS